MVTECIYSVVDKAGTAQEFEAHLLKHFPKLEEGGGFELLRSRGMTRSKDLEVIPCPDGGYTPLYLITEAGIGSATIYVRPLQANLSMDTVCFLFHLCQSLEYLRKCVC